MTYLTRDKAISYGLKFAEKNGASEVEVFSSNAKEIEIGVDKNIPTIKTGVSSGISFRVVKNGNLGFAFTKTLTKERIESTVNVALQNANSKGKDPDFKSLPHPSKKSVKEFKFDKRLEDIDSDNLASDLSALIEGINGTKGLHYLQGQMFLGIDDDRLVNSNGIDISGKGGGIGGFAAAITTKGLIPNYAFGIKGSSSLDAFKVDDLIQDTILQTQRAAAPRTMNIEGELPIILEPEASLGVMGGLLRILSIQLTGNNVASGATPYSDQVGNQVAVEGLTLVDNAVNPNKIGSSAYDSEGIPKEETLLIDKGILKTFLLDSYYGNKLGLESNGKSTRAGQFGFGGDPIKTQPTIGATSLEISPGDSSKEEIIQETKEGFMLRSLMGLHMSDASSGRFSVTGFGWYIKNGEVKYPVQGVSISGMLPDLIKNIDMISKERESMLLADAPYIRFANVKTAAKKFDFKTRFGLGILKVLTTLKIMKNPMF